MPQVKEICSHYGEFPAVLWWDTPNDMNPDRAQKLYDAVHALKPGLILNNRLGGGFKGDTETPEQFIPANGFPGRDWETCMTMNDTWGFKRDDQHWKSTETLLRNLCDIASKGGNYLLNVGPTADGVIPPPSLERLAEIGAWMKVNGEAIHGTGPTPFADPHGKFEDPGTNQKGRPKFSPVWDWRATTKPGKLYVMIFQWPADGKLELPPVQSHVKKAMLLAGNHKVDCQQDETGIHLSLPANAPDPIASVICLKMKEPAVPQAAQK